MSNLDLVDLALRRLGALGREMVLVGGTSVELLLTDPAAPEVRPTTDVDLLVGARTYGEYMAICERIRDLGFRECNEDDAPLCRWVVEDLQVDFMPLDEQVLGFSNSWYVPAYSNAREATTPAGTRLQAVTAPYFLATKAEAFRNRGGGDYLASEDLEDFVAVVDGRLEIVRPRRAARRRRHARGPGRATRWLTVLTIDPARFGATREDARRALEHENIESRPVWKPLHPQPAFATNRRRAGAVAESLFRDGLCLPSGSTLRPEDRTRIIATVRACHRAG